MKPKTKKRLKKILFITCASIIVLIVLLHFFLGHIVKAAVETMVPRITGTPVKMESFSFSIFSGKARMRNFIIGNPEGYKTEYAFKLVELLVEVNMDTIFSKKLEIDEIKVNGVHVVYEAGIASSNIGDINANVSKFAGAGKAKEKAEKPAKEAKGEGRKIQVNDFYFNGAQLSLSAVLLQGVTTTIPINDIHLQGIGKNDEGVLIGDAADQIFGAVYREIGEASSGTKALKGFF
ncbi:MAG TPA: hypothetical protein DCZ94_14685 [Lentisphaeria bacterium]|nr:MAG: hypothetical protein A2X48_02840 [Lentisphaerae bacterium GWF2_49_21]HBC88194.1 hypothetical protein [Lentisphaeria bacterium]